MAADEGLLPLESPPVAKTAEAPATEQVRENPSPAPQASSTPVVAPEGTAAVAEPAPRIRIDPLDIDPEGLDLSSLYNPPATDPLAESHLPKPADPPPSVPQVAEDSQPLPAKEAEPAVRRDDRGGVGVPLNEAALLARRLPAVDLRKAPLCRVLDLAVQLSGLPVSVSPRELQMAATSAAAPSSFSVKDATIEQLLTAAGEPLRLKPVITGKHIILKHLGEDRRRSVDYQVDDLASGTDGVNRLTDWVTQLASPGAWQAQGGDATITADGAKLRVEAPVAVQYEVLFLLERVRLTRQLPPRSKYPSALLGTGAYHADVMRRLEAPAVFTFSDFTPLREVFRHWQEETEIAILVDWPSLESERLWPQTRVSCSAANIPWSAAMDSVLSPLGLAWRAVDHRTIEITTASKVASEPMLEVYRVAKDADGEGLIASVRAMIDGASADGIVIDESANLLMVRQPAAVHRKIVAELAASLAPPNDAAR